MVKEHDKGDEEKEYLQKLRHSTAHVLAQAVKKVFPDAKLAIGPAIEDGFYYDFDLEKPFTPSDLKKIEHEMKDIIRKNYVFEKNTLSKEEAKKLFENEPYKKELIDGLEEEEATIYTNGDFTDLCKGPHVDKTGEIKAFKLTKIAGAYWKGSSENKQLQRIYGIAFKTENALKDYLKFLEEAEKRDHRKLGKELELFSFHEEGPGFPFMLPKGMIIWNELLDYWRKEHVKASYKEIKTPIILSKKLWLQSGHWDHYKDNMYFTNIDDLEYAVKPMNCPGSILAFKEKLHSYRELPLRMCELGLVHRHELSGVLAGLFRVRCFTQDDAHIFITEEQVKDEIKNVMSLIDKFYKLFGFEYHVELSTRPENYMGQAETWDKAEKALEEALKENKMDYKINPGDGAFYGPKIDFHIKDCIGRTWQCATIQLDFAMPEKFDLTYEGSDGAKHRVVMIHRVIFGSVERFFGILIEHFAGEFPIWLSPTQVRILTISDKFNAYAEDLKKKLEESNVRVEIDLRAESMGKKVREAEVQKVPLILTVGEKEEQNHTVAVRTSDNKLHFGIKTEDFVKKVSDAINEKKKSAEF